ncbi:hypothetical protein BH11ACT4_BH11ACT4_20770 [soil metagenome]
MSEEDLIVEIHVPLTLLPDAIPVADDEDQFPWIDDVVKLLEDAEQRGELTITDEGEEFGDAYVFSIADAPEDALLAVAGAVAALPGVPTGVFAMVTDDLAEGFGMGRRVELG